MNIAQNKPTEAARVSIDRPRFRLPVMSGFIDRRMLVNFRVAPEALARILPAPFRPKFLKGWGMAGICLIRLRDVRPRGLPAWMGITSENAAHRIAVEWDENGARREGVFIPRRDTGLWLNRLLGGRIFPGEHHAADFRVEETTDRYSLEMRSRDSEFRLKVVGRIAKSLSPGSVFASVEEVSAFFESGAVGWSVTRRQGVFDGLELRSFDWRVEPLAVDEVESSFFADASSFPSGSVEFDSALLMRGIQHEWHGCGRMLCLSPPHDL
jgi:hypothetical protein